MLNTMCDFCLFLALKFVTSKELSTILQGKVKSLEKVKKENVSWICNDEAVQLVRNMIQHFKKKCWLSLLHKIA